MPSLPPQRDVAAARRLAASLFAEAGHDSPALEARLLVGHALGLDHGALIASAGRLLTAQEGERLAQLIARRLTGEPVARILGMKEFWGLPFALSGATLVPRPDTETVVEAALAALGGRRDGPVRIADLGTGSGAILLALLHELPNARGIGTDRAEAAIATARSNARRLALEDRAAFAVAHFGEGLKPGFDLVVSNPPYIASAEIAALAPEVREHDPRLALDGGCDGLEAYRAIARQVPGLLHPGGRVVVEIGCGQSAQVAAIFRACGLETTDAHRDLAGIERALTFRTAGR